MSITMKRGLNVCILLLSTTFIMAQESYQIGEVSEVNLGDGRHFFRERKNEKPLNGEFRIIDGYRSEYVQAAFKDGLYDGVYKEYKRNELRTEGAYKEGRKHGTFHRYVGGVVTEEYTFRNDTLDGDVIAYFQSGKIKRKGFYKNGREQGNFKEYNWEDGHLWSDENYEDGRLHGRQWKLINGRRHGAYEAVYVPDKAGKIKEGTLKTKGEYRNDNRFGHWISYDTTGNIDREWEE